MAHLILRGGALGTALAVAACLTASPLRAQGSLEPTARGPRLAAARAAMSSHGTADPLIHAAAQSRFSHLRLESEKRPSLWRHLAVGAVGGALVGFAVGRYADRDCFDCMISATVLFVPAGAAAGTLVGGVVWLVRKPD